MQPQPENAKDDKAGKDEAPAGPDPGAAGAGGEEGAVQHKKLKETLRDATIKFLKVRGSRCQQGACSVYRLLAKSCPILHSVGASYPSSTEIRDC